MRRIVLLGLAVVLLGFMAPAAQAAPRLACGATITTSTKLKADLVCPSGTALQVKPDGAPVVLDLGGHQIKGSGVGVAISGLGNAGLATVRNGVLTGFARGVLMSDSPGSRLKDLKLVGPGSDQADSVGVEVFTSPTFVLDGVTIKGYRSV
ncbi:hypothetical protein GCM10022197_07840 [Microlunatus spumicola]|uniref:Uncharacterized protein n=1 Tax=Microlunatus spumicola TaxID=81499 RepID=A0ABP6WQI3_9ACTN